MSYKKDIKGVQVFEEYPIFYQPYIPPVVDELRRNSKVDIRINTYKWISDKEVKVISFLLL